MPGLRERAGFKRLDRWLGVPLVAGLGLLRRRSAPRPLAPGDRVLAIKFSALGDTLLLLPVLKALRAKLGPQGRLEMLATPVNAAALRGAGYLDAVHLLQPAELAAAPWRALGLLRRLRRGGFDWALDFDQWLRAPALFGWASGARARAGFRTPGQAKHGLFHRSLENRAQVHEFEQFAALAGLAGLERAAVPPYWGFLLEQGFLGAAPAPRGAAPLVLLHPGAGGAGAWQREWPVERYAQLGRRLQARGLRVGLSGSGPREAQLCREIAAGLSEAPAEDCVDKGLPALVAALCRADLLLSGNTGVMHLAAGLGRPLLALHGPNPAAKWGPRGDAPGSPAPALALQAELPCSPCLTLGFEFGCPARPCMESFSLERVESACLGLLPPVPA